MFQTALEHINLNTNNFIKIRQFQLNFRGKLTKGLPSAQTGRTPQGFSGRHTDPGVFATEVETSHCGMAQFREMLSKKLYLLPFSLFSHSRASFALSEVAFLAGL